MPCPTCDATMEGIGSNDRGDNCFLCPRCGTVLIDAFGQHGDKVYVPKLVERCREFERLVKVSDIMAIWHRLGLAESINTPGERKL